ncbi:GNAT family N-acetyltransferase [Vibrio vulnificus]|uniref:GNAT family N-acetyltransferase n=1 Tax=Vibrio parahaemolyticus TaxID=670 RepID=UPI001A2B7E21|nr:GNAT family N-acetyltransferase [Vibrio vulnificus]MCF9331647.1 GNAT family N-acetyltransferase [Vibrio parahaemolyticus]EJC6746958.1 GNAT family N-acetyltransferase [Vibrio vulnificus]EJC6822235.1 GNAT family N-acetyltransferase [Vibrio vulnificus]EJC6955949.1 GNAT family N-acetyltransferase [Vibrio vulnificus]
MQQVVESERLILRPFSLSDAKRVSELAGDKQISKMTANIPYPYRISDAENWIRTHAELFLSGKGVVYAIALKDSDELIGAISFPKLENGLGILGYWLGVPYWGCGYATEASKTLISYSKKHYGLTRLKVMHLVENERSKSVIEKLGVKYVGDQINRMQGKNRTVSVYISKV